MIYVWYSFAKTIPKLYRDDIVLVQFCQNYIIFYTCWCSFAKTIQQLYYSRCTFGTVFANMHHHYLIRDAVLVYFC